MRAVYESLLQGLAQALQLDPLTLLASGALRLGGVDFRLQLNALPDEAVLLLLCRFGPLPAMPPDQTHAAVCRLLQTNLQLVDGAMCSFFALDESGAEVVYCVRMLLLDCTVDELLACLRVCAQEASAWHCGASA